jgi:hypothetical protein
MIITYFPKKRKIFVEKVTIEITMKHEKQIDTDMGSKYF